MIKISQPTLIINESIARSNIRMMAEKAKRNSISFEPHFKTHQSKDVAEWFRDEGVVAITVSSISMALYFAQNGWTKITVAFPVNILELAKINELASKVDLTLLVQDVETIKRLNNLNKVASLYIEIDTGYHRSGVEHDSIEEIEQLIKSINLSTNKFIGFYAHAGNSYEARNKTEIKNIYADFELKLADLKNAFKEYEPYIAIGDTPTCSVVDKFNGINSIHPGNFVYYDYTQVQIGSCQLNQIATYMLCPVVAKSINRNEIVIYGGGVHLSKEGIVIRKKLEFGLVGQLNAEGEFTPFKNSHVKSISQEHGIISSSAQVISSIQVGDILAIIPVHSCMTVDCMTEIYTDGGIQINKMPL